MKSNKDRDLAQELVDFLSKQEEKKPASLSEVAEIKKESHNTVVTVDPVITSPLDTGLHADVVEATPKKRISGPKPASAVVQSNRDSQPVEFDLDLGEGHAPDVDFNKKNEKSQNIMGKIPTKKDNSRRELFEGPAPQGKPTDKPEAIKFEIEVTAKEPEQASPRISSPAELRQFVPKVMPLAQLEEKPRSTHSDKTATTPKTEFKFGQTMSKDAVLANQLRGNAIFSEASQLLGGAEAIRSAQARITQLEANQDRLRDENEKLLSATEALSSRVTELKTQYENLERKHREKIEILEEEKLVLRSRLGSKEQELGDLKKRYEDFQGRFQNDLRKVRVRERELENRHELLKAEMVAIVQTKDEMILELKRQLEQLHFELDNFRSQSADLNHKVDEFHERNHRTVKALRLALSVLELGDGNEDKAKKAAG